MARSMLDNKILPKNYWAKVVVVVVHILNISLKKAMRNISPYEAWFHRKPNVSHLKVFGCVSYELINENAQGQMDKKSEKCIFIGYSNDNKGYYSIIQR